MPAPIDREPHSKLSPRIDLGGFLILPENRSAVRAVQSLARQVLRGGRVAVCPLVLHGPPGCGKTHLTRAALAALVNETPEITARSESAGDLARPDTVAEGLADRALWACDVLVLEDVQHLPERAADAVCDLIDRRAARKKALVVTANSGPAGLAHLPRRLTSRLAAGLVVQLEPLGAASRRTILEAGAKAKKLRLTPDALDLLAEQASGGGVRAALGLLQNLAHVAPNFPGPLNRAAVEQVLAGTGQPTSRGATLEAIMKCVCVAFGVSEKELLGTSRLRSVMLPRQVAMYLARELAGLSLPRIGAAFARDHTTVLHACRKVEETLAADEVLKSRVKQLKGELG
jgi:chromosomal replication initiator protein